QQCQYKTIKHLSNKPNKPLHYQAVLGSFIAQCHSCMQGRTDNSRGPQAIGDHGPPVSLPKLKKAYEKGTRGISWGPLLTPSPRAVPEFPNGQSAPDLSLWK
ncbi:unnamed protein product, partial [Staurois parvus]